MILEDQQDINNAIEGRKYLEKHSLLCPPGEPPTHSSLSTCLHQVSAMAGVQKPVLNAIRSIAFLLEEIEETQINLMVKEAFDSQITEFTSDMKLLIEDAREKIDEHLKISEDRINQMVDNASVQTKQPQHNGGSYASILATPPPYANPKIAAREGIKARQFLLEGIKDTKLSNFDSYQLKTELNKILLETGLKGGNIRSVNNLRNGGTLIELDSDGSTTWMLNSENRAEFCLKIGPKVTSRTRSYNLIAFNVPLAIDPENRDHRLEICEVNNVRKDEISAIRWAKPVNRRTPEQRTAHLILTLTSADAANRAITDGLTICNRRCHVERVKREPIRCLKCQGWNHFAKDCLEKEDKCGNCAGRHKTSDCTTPQDKYCVSCKTADHASWFRNCPTFIKKLNELNARNPENALQYIPTADPWTWTTCDKPSSPPMPSQTATQVRPLTNYERPQPMPQKTQAQTRRVDTYFPRKRTDTYIPKYGSKHPSNNRPQGMNVGDEVEGMADLREFRPLTQNTIDVIESETMNRPTNPSQKT